MPLRLFHGRTLSALLLILVRLPRTLLHSGAPVLLLFLRAPLLLVALVPSRLRGALSLLGPVSRLLSYVPMLFIFRWLLLSWALSFLRFVPLCVRRSCGPEKEQQNSRADSANWFHESHLGPKESKQSINEGKALAMNLFSP